jgi:hypothetical protein
MAEQQQTGTIEVPAALSQLIAVNVEFKVLLCLGSDCRKAVSPTVVEYLRKIHHEKPLMRQQLLFHYSIRLSAI